MDALWTIQKIMDNENNRIEINVNVSPPIPITGFAVSDTFSISTGSSYSEVAETIGAAVGDIVGGIPGLGDSLTRAWSSISSTLNAGAAILGVGKTVAGSVLKWDGSTDQLPPLNLLFVALKPDDRPQDSANTLLSLCMPGSPRENPLPGDADIWFWAPNGYSPAKVLKSLVGNEGAGYSGVDIEGTCTLKIGKWLEVSGLLPEAATFEFSKETTRAGNPLYVTGTMTFKTYRDRKAHEFKQMFK